MKILSVLHGYPPHNNSGAEHTLHAFHKYLISKGHEVVVWCNRLKDYKLDGVTVKGGMDKPTNDGYDFIFTHLNYTGIGLNLSRQWKLPLVYFTHNDTRNGVVSVQKKGIYVVHNSNWIIDNCDLKNHPHIVVNPPTFKEDYILKGRKSQDKVTLVNLNKNKGGYVLVDIAKRMPDVEFLAVKGAYGDQVTKYPKNVEVIDTQKDIRTVLRQTKILLMPSQYESWGKIGVEAMVNGIPVLAHPTKGLKESLGTAGIFNDRKDTTAWVDHINDLLTDENAYKERSEMCKLRAKELDPMEQLEKFEGFLKEIKVNAYKHSL